MKVGVSSSVGICELGNLEMEALFLVLVTEDSPVSWAGGGWEITWTRVVCMLG